MPPVDGFELLLWVVFTPMGFFYSIFKRAARNRFTCPKCGKAAMRG